MNYWLLTIQSLNNPFTYLEVEQVFQMDIRINTDLSTRGSNNAVFRTESISVDDELVGYVSTPTQEIRYIFKVVDITNTKIKLRKVLESSYGVSLETIRAWSMPTYTSVLNADPNEVGKLVEVDQEFFEKVETALVSEFFHDEMTAYTPPEDRTEIHHEPQEPYVAPTKNPKTAKLPHNRIVFGAPGTGKSFKLEEEREEYFANNYERVTFHPNYSYGQFVGTYKPRPIKGTTEITYELVPGPLLRTLEKALEKPERNYVLIVEEINRANTAAVFGDIFQLLDRNEDGRSEYNIMVSEDVKDYLERNPSIRLVNNELYLPDNFYLWSTMNTADQGVYPMDSAFKRRFDFEYIGINDNDDEIENLPVPIPGVGTIDWNDFRKELNKFLLKHVRNMKEDKLIGPFFIKKKVIEAVAKETTVENEEAFQKMFKNKLLMYLSEDILKTTNKLILFKFNSFSEIIEEFVEGGNVFSDEFIQALQDHLR
jgi:5-methylcytosine-specific restriction enzyme B